MSEEEDNSSESTQLRLENEIAQFKDEIKSCLILHDKVREALNLIDEVRRNRNDGTERRGVLIFGDSRSGKSRLLKYYLEMNPSYVDETGRTIRPVVELRLDNIHTTEELCMALLKELGDPAWEYGKQHNRIVRVREQLISFKVEVVLIDESQHFVARGQEITLQKSADFVKGLIDSTNVAFVLVGVASATRFFQIDGQARNRFMTPVELKIEIGVDTKADFESVHGILSVLMKLSDTVAMIGRSDLINLPMGTRICLATGGLIGLIIDLLRDAGKLALSDGRESIKTKDLAKAYKRLIGTSIPGVGNPFTADIVSVTAALNLDRTRKGRNNGVGRRTRPSAKQLSVRDVARLK